MVTAARSFAGTFVVSTPSWITASSFEDDGLADFMQSYDHTVVAMGGYDTARLSGGMDAKMARRWIQAGLGRNFAFFSPQGQKRWEGFINQIKLDMGSASFTLGPLIDISNKSYVAFSTVTYNTNPPIGGMATKTATANAASSQARYGIFETALNGGSGLLAVMEEIRDLYLAENSEPDRDGDLSLDSSGQVSVSFDMLGYFHLLKRYVYRSTTTGTQDLRAKLLAVLAADPSSRFSTNQIHVAANAYQVPAQEVDERFAWDVIQDLLAIGDGSGNRMIFGIYNDRVPYYQAVPAKLAQQMLLADASQGLQSRSGALIYPWDVRPGQWLTINDFMIGGDQVVSLKENMSNILTETVSYNSPYGLRVNGIKVETLPQIMARYGIGSI